MTPNDTTSGIRIMRRRALTGMGAALTPFALAGGMPSVLATQDATAPGNALGIRRIMFAVDDLDDVLARLRNHGAELVGEVVQYEDSYRLCYVHGPEGIMVALAEQLS